MDFKLHSEYQPTGDQPQAIKELVEGFRAGNQFQTLLGVTGSGKTFTIANVIAALNKPTLIISHNKTLAGQLYSEMKEFFPENAVEYFVSYYEKRKMGVHIVLSCAAQSIYCGLNGRDGPYGQGGQDDTGDFYSNLLVIRIPGTH